MLVPVPCLVSPPGVLVRVQLPVADKPLMTTAPVDTVHVGWVIVPSVGTVGVGGCALTTTSFDADEVQPDVPVTVKA